MSTRRGLHLALGAVLVAACSGPTASSAPPGATAPSAAPTVAPSPTVFPSTSTVALDAIMPMNEAAQLGLNHDYTEVGDSALTFVVQSGREADFEALAGFIDGQLAGFSGGAGALLAAALAFDTAAQAQTGLDLFVDELRSPESYDLGAAEPTQLGDEGVCGSGPNPHLDGLVESICVWRNGTVVLIAGGPMAMTEIRMVAAAMDARSS